MNKTEFLRPSKNRNLKSDEGRLSGYLEYGILSGAEHRLRVLAYNFDLDLTIEKLGGFLIKKIRFEVVGKDIQIIKAYKHLNGIAQ